MRAAQRYSGSTQTWGGQAPSRLASCLLLLVACAGCGPEPQPIRIGISAWAGVEPAELAARLGYYEDRGVAVEMVRFSAYTDSIETFFNGRVDIDMQTFDDAIRLRTRGKRLKIVLFTDYSYGGDGIVARAGIDSMHDLAGKMVGVETGTVGHYSLLRALAASGLEPEDINIVSIPALEIEEALARGEIDAGVTWEPYLTRGAEQLGGRVLITSRDYPKAIVTTMAVSEELLASRRAEVLKVVAAYFDAVDFIERQPETAYEIMGRAEGISGDEFAHHAEGLRYIDLAENATAFGGPGAEGEMYAVGRDLAAFLHDERMIDSPPEIGEMLDGSFVNQLAGRSQ